MRKAKIFEDFIEIYDDGVLTDRLPKTNDQYTTVELMLGSLEPIPDKVSPGNVPNEVSMRQGRLALLQFGLLHTVNAIIASMPGIQGDAARIEWEYATGIKRDSDLVKNLMPYLVLNGEPVTEDQMDQMFLLAETFK